MSPHLAHPLPPLHHNLLQVRKPPVARDLQSTSTVTSSASPSSSSTSSPQPSNSSSPLSTSNQSPTTWQLHHHTHTTITPPTSPGSQSVRTLPRCGVVNFRKDGDNLRWAPRVTHNSSGVAARVHNFEDAFSLEEFSSRALPVVWRSTGGNPRLSDAAKSHPDHSPASTRSPRSISTHSDDPPPSKRSIQLMEKRAKSMGSQRALVRNPSVKKAVALATEAYRPSVWSILARSTKYQRSKAKTRIQNNADINRPDTSNKRPEHTPFPSSRRTASKKDVPTTTADSIAHRQPWATLSRHKAQRVDRRGKATRRAPETSDTDKKTSSLFQRLLSHLDRRNAKKCTFEDTMRSHPGNRNRMAFSRSDGSSGSDSGERSLYGDRSKGLFTQSRHSEGYSSRRVVSALASNLGPLKGSHRREFARVSSQDDQYVTFMTSES